MNKQIIQDQIDNLEIKLSISDDRSDEIKSYIEDLKKLLNEFVDKKIIHRKFNEISEKIMIM